MSETTTTVRVGGIEWLVDAARAHLVQRWVEAHGERAALRTLKSLEKKRVVRRG